jgi:hypothetical protein
MRVFKYIYYHNGEVLCEEYINDSITHKLKLEMYMSFYRLEDGQWVTEFDYMLPTNRKLELKMKMVKMVIDEVYYESVEVVDDLCSNFEEW